MKKLSILFLLMLSLGEAWGQGTRKDTSLHIAIENNNFEEVEELIRQGANFNTSINLSPVETPPSRIDLLMAETALRRAIKVNNDNIINILVENNGKIRLDFQEFGGNLFHYLINLTPKLADMQMSDEKGKLKVKKTIKQLLGNNDINQRNSFGATALFYAQDTTIIQYLLDLGANVNAKDKQGRTALSYRLGEGKIYTMYLGGGWGLDNNVFNKKLATYLVKKGSDIHQISQTLFYFREDGMSQSGLMNPKMAKELGFNFDKKFGDGQTYLYKSVYLDSLNYVGYLLDKGININLICKDGNFRKTAFYLALERKNVSIINTLWKYQPDISIVCYDGESEETVYEYVKKKNFQSIESYITYLRKKPQIRIGNIEAKKYEKLEFSTAADNINSNYTYSSKSGRYIIKMEDTPGMGVYSPRFLWDTEKNRKIMQLDDIRMCQSEFVFSDDDKYLLDNNCGVGTLEIYDPSTGEKLYESDFEPKILLFSKPPFLPKNDGIIFQEKDKLSIWDFINDERIDIEHDFKEFREEFKLSQDKKHLLLIGSEYSESDKGRISIYSVASYYQNHDFDLIRKLENIAGIDFCMNDTHVIYIKDDNKTIQVMNISTGEVTHHYQSQNEINYHSNLDVNDSYVKVTEDGRFLISKDDEGVTSLWGQFQQSEPLRVLPPTKSFANLNLHSYNNSQNRTNILLSNENNWHQLDFSNVNIFTTLSQNTDNVIAYSSDGELLAYYTDIYKDEITIEDKEGNLYFSINNTDNYDFERGNFSNYNKFFTINKYQLNSDYEQINENIDIYHLKTRKNLTPNILNVVSQANISKNLAIFGKYKVDILRDFQENQSEEELKVPNEVSISNNVGKIQRTHFSNNEKTLYVLYEYENLEKKEYKEYNEYDEIRSQKLKWQWIPKQKIVFWDLSESKVVEILDTNGINGVFPVNDNSFAIVQSTEQRIRVKNYDDNSIKDFPLDKEESIHGIVLSPDKQKLLIYTDNSFKVYDYAKKIKISEFLLEHYYGKTEYEDDIESEMREIVFISNDKIILSDGKIVNINTGRLIANIDYVQSFTKIENPDYVEWEEMEEVEITTEEYEDIEDEEKFIEESFNEKYKELLLNSQLLITTPDDYYMTNQRNIGELIYFESDSVLNDFSQFDLQYNRPDIVLERIGLASDTLIQTYRLAYQKRLEKMGFSEKRIKLFMNGEFDKDFNAPEIELLGKGNFVFEETTQSEYTFGFTAKDAKYKIERIFVNVDGVPLYGAKGDILKNPSQNLAKREIKVPLIAGKNMITLSVINEQGVASLEKRLEITYNPPQPTKPTLYVFSIGINEYQDKDITKLDYAVKDAEKVVELFAQNKGDFAKVKNFTLTDAEVNKESVLKLRQELLKTNPEDMVIFNFAGHGFLDDSTNYYLGTYDTDLNNLSQTGLKYDAVESLLDGIPARKKLMFIDACHSGEVDKESVKGFQKNKRTRKRTRSDGTTYEVNVLSQTAFEVMKTSFSDLRIGTGTTVISASGGLETATEDYTWGHGAFTYTLIQGLQEKKADLDKNGKITVSELQTYLADEVQRLTDGFQKPTSRIENIVNDFVVWE